VAILSGKILVDKNNIHGPPKVHEKWEYGIGNILILIIPKIGMVISRKERYAGFFHLFMFLY
jgi:hypothetical protein